MITMLESPSALLISHVIFVLSAARGAEENAEFLLRNSSSLMTVKLSD
jgi:hypothetical protein